MIKLSRPSKFHVLGDPADLYEYNTIKNNMKTYYISHFGSEDDFEQLYLDKSKDELYDLYHETIDDMIQTDEFQIGDIVYKESEYESRQYYGIYIILMKNSKKVLVNDEGNIFKMIPNKLKEIFDSYPNFFEQSKSELNKFSDKYLY